jgi:Zn finger protein HypA/HybF involved in hydrogenase expression
MFYNNNSFPNKNSKNRKIQEIYKDELNNQCFDCGQLNPDFISENNGVFICKNCMSVHYQFTDEVSLIIKNNLFLLNEEQINYI